MLVSVFSFEEKKKKNDTSNGDGHSITIQAKTAGIFGPQFLDDPVECLP